MGGCGAAGVGYVFVCMCACMHACMHACMYVCMHVCMYGYMYACTYVYVYACVSVHIGSMDVRRPIVCMHMPGWPRPLL